jgi:hypothetical protein
MKQLCQLYKVNTEQNINNIFLINMTHFLFRTTRELEIFFSEFNIRLYDNNSESDYFFFPPPKSEYFFQQHWESEYFFRKKTITPPSS